MTQAKRSSLPGMLLRYDWLILRDTWQYLLVVLVVPTGVTALMAVMSMLFQEEGGNIVLSIGLPGLFAALCAVFCSIGVAGSVFSVSYKMGVHMGVPRRALLPALLGAALILSGVLAGFTALYNAAWVWALGHFGNVLDLLALLPAWGWAAVWYLPAAVGLFGAGVVIRFGRRGFWVLYALFMAVCLAPSLSASLPDRLLDTVLPLLPAVLPFALPALGAALALAGAGLLWAAPLTD